MRSESLTADSLRRRFDAQLARTIETGEYPRSCQGFDPDTRTALAELADSFPDVQTSLVVQARTAHTLQLARLIEV